MSCFTSCRNVMEDNHNTVYILTTSLQIENSRKSNDLLHVFVVTVISENRYQSIRSNKTPTLRVIMKGRLQDKQMLWKCFLS